MAYFSRAGVSHKAGQLADVIAQGSSLMGVRGYEDLLLPGLYAHICFTLSR